MAEVKQEAHTEVAQKGGLPQLDPNLANYSSQLFWLAVTFVLLYLLMSRIALPRVGSVLQNRKEKIGGSIEEAETLSNEAKELEEKYSEEIQKTKRNASDLIQEVQAQSREDAMVRHRELDKVLESRLNVAEEKITSMREKAFEELAAKSVDPTLSIAKKIGAVDVTSKKAEKTISKIVKEKVA